jgi:hypothetical protein
MITNHLLLKIKDPNTDNISKAAEVLRGMQGRIEYLRTLQVETDIRRGPSSYHILLVAGFDSMQDFDAYLTHPVHVEVATYIGTVIEHAASVCYESNQ